MKAYSLREAIGFVMKNTNVISYIQKLEAQPNRFAIKSISATVKNYQTPIITVTINFNEKNNPNSFKEDIEVDLSGSTMDSFQVKEVRAAEIS